MPGQGIEINQRGTKRARRACLNCRRKKSRCPGELPECSFCARLGQQCQYSDAVTRKNQVPAGAGQAIPNDPHYGELINRISQLEQKLGTISETPDDTVSRIGSLIPTSIEPFQTVWQPNNLSGFRETIVSSPSQSTSWMPVESDALPPSFHIQSAVDDFFLHSHNQPYSFFNELNFRIRLAEGLLPNYLIFAVLATAARFSTTNVNKDVMAHTCAQSSWKLISKHMETDEESDISIVQAATLLAIFDFTACKNRSAWRKIGTAARLAQDLRLMFEPDSSLPITEKEERRRTFWSIYLLDCLVTCGRARPPILQDHFCKLNLPSTEYAFRDGQSEITGNINQFLHDKDIEREKSAPFARVIVTATILGRCTRYVLQDVNVRCERPPWDTSSDYAAVHSTLLDLEAQFEFRRPIRGALEQDCMTGGQLDRHSAEMVAFSYVLYHLCQCLLNHHFLLRRRLEPYSSKVPPTFIAQASDACRLHARNLTVLLEDARSLGCILHSSFFGYCSLVSGTINALHRYSEDPEIQRESKICLEMNFAFLSAHSHYWENAKPMLDVLQRFSRDAAAFSDLINPGTLMFDFDAATVERLYDIVDYSVVSQHREHANQNFASASSSADFDILDWISSSNDKGEQCFSEGMYSTLPPLLRSESLGLPPDANHNVDYLAATSDFMPDLTTRENVLDMVSQAQSDSNTYVGHQL